MRLGQLSRAAFCASPDGGKARFVSLSAPLPLYSFDGCLRIETDRLDALYFFSLGRYLYLHVYFLFLIGEKKGSLQEYLNYTLH